MSQANITIHIEAEHTCGYMHETILHVKDANLEGFINTQYPEWPTVRSGEFTPHVEPETENHLELTGSLGGVEFDTCESHMSRLARLKLRIAAYLRSLFSQKKEQENYE